MFMNLNQRMIAGRLPARISALQQLEAMARRIGEAEGVTREKAFAKAVNQRPDLYDQYRSEQGEEAKARAEKQAAEIRELVALAGFPSHTAEAAIKDGTSPAQVRAALLRCRRTEHRA